MSQIETEKIGENIGRPLGLFDLIDRILDKGLVIDAYVSVTIVGIELLVVRARIVAASIETFLRYASAMGLYGEPGGTIQRGASGGERREPQQQQQPTQGQQQQQQPIQGQQLQQLLQQLQQQLQQPLQQVTKPLQQQQQ